MGSGAFVGHCKLLQNLTRARNMQRPSPAIVTTRSFALTGISGADSRARLKTGFGRAVDRLLKPAAEPPLNPPIQNCNGPAASVPAVDEDADVTFLCMISFVHAHTLSSVSSDASRERPTWRTDYLAVAGHWLEQVHHC